MVVPMIFCYHNEENRSHACVSVDLTNVLRARYVCVSRLCYHNEENRSHACVCVSHLCYHNEEKVYDCGLTTILVNVIL